MHRYLFGILLIQLVTIAIFWLNLFGTGNPNETDGPVLDIALYLRILIPIVLLAIMTAFWFSSIGRSAAEKTIAKMKEAHSRDREKIQLNAEKAKTRMVKETQKEIRKESRRASGKANFKVGLAFMATAAAGVVMVFIELVTMGMMTMMTAGGALGGYVLRARRELPAAKKSGRPLPVEDDLHDDKPYEVLEPEKVPRLINKKS